MRPITKIFLLLVVAFVAYLIWPRSANIKNFNPPELAKLQVQVWQAEKAGRPTAALWARFKIYTSQFHFSPVAAFQIAQNEGAAISDIKPSEAAAEASDDSPAVHQFTEKFSSMKGQLGAEFDANNLAHEEYTWRSMLADKAPVDQLTVPVSNILAAFYGGAPGDFADVAANIVNAQGYIFGTVATPDGQDPVKAAIMTAQDGFKLLKEIAAQPAPEAAAPDASAN